MNSALALHLLGASLLAQPAKEPDISCEQSRSYIGNAISPVFTLKIGGPRKPEWSYSVSDDMFGTAKPPLVTEYRGTYEIDGDLAVFTGEQAGDKPRAIRFGLNFGFPDGKVSFDRFFPNAKGEFSYHRKWFRQKGKEWLPAEERQLTLTLPEEIPEALEVHCKGRRVLWDADGKRSEEPIDVKLRYKRSQADWYTLEKPEEQKQPALPGELILERAKGKVVAITWSNRYIGDLRGFQPGAAERAGAR
jgi:hypothetical protein